MAYHRLFEHLTWKESVAPSSSTFQLEEWLFFQLGFTPCKPKQPLHGVTRKEAQKRLQNTENLFRRNLQLKDIC